MERDFEYMDIICDSLLLGFFRSIGFRDNSKDDFVPNKFEPLVKENSKILYATTLIKDEGFFRGDSDQDRPSL